MRNRRTLYRNALEHAAVTALIAFCAVVGADAAAGVDVAWKVKLSAGALAAVAAFGKAIGSAKLPWSPDDTGSALPAGMRTRRAVRRPHQ